MERPPFLLHYDVTDPEVWKGRPLVLSPSSSLQVFTKNNWWSCKMYLQNFAPSILNRPVSRLFRGRVRSNGGAGPNERLRLVPLGGPGACSPGKFWKIACLRLHFVRFEGSMTWKQAAKSEHKRAVYYSNCWTFKWILLYVCSLQF